VVSEINPRSHRHLKHVEGQTASLTSDAGKTGRRLKLHLSPCTKINSKWIKGFSVRPETLEMLEENTGNTSRGRHRERLSE
jgi:hypothetical protein